jgi:trimeric autotransporter adhesin
VGITVDTVGNVYFTDASNYCVRKVEKYTGIITTIAGNGSSTYSGDYGPATNATFNATSGLCFDKFGNLYICDFHRVRKIDTAGIITTVVGNGSPGFTGDGGQATNAKCNPGDIKIDTFGNLYISQPLSTIRKVNTLGIISTIAGDSISHIYNGDGIPATNANLDPTWLAIDKNGLLYISDESNNNRIRVIDSFGIIHTYAGNGLCCSSGDGGPATVAKVNATGLAFDLCGNLFFGQVNNPRIRKVALNPSCYPTKLTEIQPSELTLYPNPATTELHIDKVESGTKYALFNITGIMQLSGLLQEGSNSINIRHLAEGIYLLEITNNEGVKTVKKIIKQ